LTAKRIACFFVELNWFLIGQTLGAQCDETNCRDENAAD
jgi:hypothetical protein